MKISCLGPENMASARGGLFFKLCAYLANWFELVHPLNADSGAGASSNVVGRTKPGGRDAKISDR